MNDVIEGQPTELPPALAVVRTAAARVKLLESELGAEMERRDRHIVEALDGGYSYRRVAAAAHEGDGAATVSLVQNAVKKYG